MTDDQGLTTRELADASAQAGDDGQTGRPAQPDREPLLPADQTERYTARWQEIQTSIVDDPRS
jgi:hypothetical protein